MYNLVVPIASVNPVLLDQQLSAALTPARFGGLSTGSPGSVSIWMQPDHTPAEDATAQQTCAAHVSSQQTAQQVKDAANDAAIANLKTAIDTEIAHFAAGTFTTSNLSTNAQVQTEFVRLANDMSKLAQLLERKLLS